jgi:hypothetical protein
MILRTSFCAALVAFALVLAMHAPSARATVIPLPATGTDSSGNALPGGSADPHYTVTGPGIPGGGSAAVYSPPNLWGQWVPNDAHSAWIGWSDNSDTSPHGNYTFELKFSLAGFNPASASLGGSWAADQFGSINLNGNSTGVSVPDGNWNAANAPNLTPFTISSGFQSGINTLDFVVDETDGFDGLRVRNLSLTATAVPEPSAPCLLLTAGASGLFGLIWRRRR